MRLVNRVAWCTAAILAISTLGWGQALQRMSLPRMQVVKPQPDKDGVYSQGQGMTPAKLVQGAQAVFRSEPNLAKVKHVCAFRVVVGVDGTPSSIELLNQHPSQFDDAAVAAVKESQFSPAVYQGEPVPTRMTLWVPFIGGKDALPALVSARLEGVTPPVAGNSVNAEFPAQARKDKVESGIVLVHVRVSEEGKVLDPTVIAIAPAGHGFDENALRAVRQYRFKPATFQGAPVPMDITVEVNFQGY